jgi:hypothetical protein
MSLGQVFEVGSRILRRHPAVILLVALLFVGPGALLSSATALRFSEVAFDLFPDLGQGAIDATPTFTDDELRRLVEAVVPFLGASLVAGILGSIGALGFSAIVADDYHARPARSGSVLRAALRHTPSALVFMLVTGLIVTGLIVLGLLGMSAATLILPAASVGAGGPGVFLALVIGVGLALALVYLAMRWAPAYASMVEEDAGAREALRRSWHLSADNVLRIFVVSATVVLLTAMLSSLISALLDSLFAAALVPSLGLDPLVASTVALAISSLLVAPVMPIFTAVLFFDLRTRRDLPAAPPAPSSPDELPR